MKVGDLVTCNHPNRRNVIERRLGVIIKNVEHNIYGPGCTNKVFSVLWRSGRVDNKLWDYDLKVVNESRRFSSVDRA